MALAFFSGPMQSNQSQLRCTNLNLLALHDKEAFFLIRSKSRCTVTFRFTSSLCSKKCSQSSFHSSRLSLQVVRESFFFPSFQSTLKFNHMITMTLWLAQPIRACLSAYCLSCSHLGNDRKYGGLEPPGPPARTATAGHPHTDDARLTVEARLAPFLSVDWEYNRLSAFILPVFSLRLAALSHPPDDHCRDLPALGGLLRVDLSSLWTRTSIRLGGRSVMKVYIDLLPPRVLPLVAQSSADEPCRGEERVRLAVQLLRRAGESRSGHGGRPGLTSRTRAVFTAVFHHSVALCTWSEEPRTWKWQIKSLHQMSQALSREEPYLAASVGF